MGSINVRVAAWLLEQGHTKEKLAGLLKMSTTTLDKKINGKTEWTWTQAQALSTILGCSLDDLTRTAQL